jgi:hypothetical protein
MSRRSCRRRSARTFNCSTREKVPRSRHRTAPLTPCRASYEAREPSSALGTARDGAPRASG